MLPLFSFAVSCYQIRAGLMPQEHSQQLLATVTGREPREGPGNQLALEMEIFNMFRGTICASL